jgi:hypothetical protein
VLQNGTLFANESYLLYGKLVAYFVFVLAKVYLVAYYLSVGRNCGVFVRPL